MESATSLETKEMIIYHIKARGIDLCMKHNFEWETISRFPIKEMELNYLFNYVYIWSIGTLSCLMFYFVTTGKCTLNSLQ
jgi:hypothetical protein